MKTLSPSFAALALALSGFTFCAQAAPSQQYISDQITVVVRDAPRNDATFLSSIKSGDRVTVLETLGDQSFAKIRTGDGRTGWIIARYLTPEPVARTIVNDVRRELTEAQSRIRDLEARLGQTRASLEKARPALELAGDNERLREQVDGLQRSLKETEQRYGVEKERRRTMLTGAGLAGAGIVLGLILPWLLRSNKRRRWGDF
ncbi:TIGR04211 family SH3 domain-containing protein [Sinimarinibacterium sp. NLF-5-8]|uniref:TIGR04211 family SH3 domain-containing protein n=1 Tax=Sinimarinibacterium sp. NLF-5-8 TaxID=2698684 RepID=UPI00137BEAA4|nr:TIGR04211 family SH3 domain-containing protein [Sinimarinibacterium sp. NLF-5-8]QHS10593.1 TIGR04211 family SH3 domain-containing protein [Sinimarinibacterium sp. NLF-5-8]